jgi:hypothetical protein
MEKRDRRLVGHIDGKGSLSRDGVDLGPAEYRGDVYQEFLIFGDGDEVPAQKELDIRVDHRLDDFQLWQGQDTVRLHLEDGRYIDGSLDGARFIPGGQLMNADGSRADN